MRCPYCGVDTDQYSEVCTHCGGLVRAAAVAPGVPDYAAEPSWPPAAPAGYDHQQVQPYSPAGATYYAPAPVTAAPQPSGRRTVNAVWLLAVAVLLLTLAVLVTQLPFLHGHHTAAPDRSAASGPAQAAGHGATSNAGGSQAQAIDALLTVTAGSRASLGSALAALSGCGDAAQAQGVLSRIVQERGDQLTRAQQLTVQDLPNGDGVKGLLIAALSDSLQADRAYLAWAQDVVAQGCGTESPNRQAGDTASAAATVAKQRFVQAWNPVAVQFGLPTRTETEV